MRTACIELAKYGITVNAVMPGYIMSEGLQGLGEEYLETMAASIPLKPLGSVDDIGHAAARAVGPVLEVPRTALERSAVWRRAVKRAQFPFRPDGTGAAEVAGRLLGASERDGVCESDDREEQRCDPCVT